MSQDDAVEARLAIAGAVTMLSVFGFFGAWSAGSLGWAFIALLVAIPSGLVTWCYFLSTREVDDPDPVESFAIALHRIQVAKEATLEEMIRKEKLWRQR